MLSEVKGLVIKAVDMRESDRLITVFTEEMGIITAMAKGSRSLKSRNMSTTMPFCYSSFVLYKKGDNYWIRESELHESFFGIRESIEGLALAGYILEVIAHVAVEAPERDLLRLTLNSLYAISSGRYSLNKVKAAFEIRALSILGFMPSVLSCRDCGRETGDFFFDIMGGYIRCPDCRDKMSALDTDDAEERRIVTILSEGAKIALGYCIHAPLEKIFSFSISEEDASLFSKACEQYLLNQLERPFKTLDFYLEVSRPRKPKTTE